MSANNPPVPTKQTAEGLEVILPPSSTAHQPTPVPPPSPSKPVGAPLVGKPPPNSSKAVSISSLSSFTTTPTATPPTTQPVTSPHHIHTPASTLPPLPPLAPIPASPPVQQVLPPTPVISTPPPTTLEVPPVGMYEEIEDNSSEILGFDELKGFGLKVRTAVHPHVGLDTTLSFPLAAGVAFAYSSAPLSRILIKKDTAEALANPTLPPPLPYYIPVKSFYINAMIDPTQTLHLDYFHRYSQTLSWKLYGVSSIFEKDSTDLLGKFIFDKPNYNLQLKGSTDNQCVGASFLRRVAPKWFVGSEIFFSNTKKSGGFSAGTQYFDKLSPYRPQWTATVNTMGDITTTFTSAIVPAILTGSARYNFNTNNHESEVGLGVSYTPKDLPLTVKARWDNTNKWGVLATLKVALGKASFLATAGISGGAGDEAKSPSYGAVLSVDF